MGSPAEWWRTFFTGAAVDSWLLAVPEGQTATDADFIQEELQVGPSAEVLDVPCGGGRLSLALAGRGYAMTGVDISEDFLAAARSKTVAASGSVAWEHREMRDLPWPGRFDGAFCFGNSFGYLDDSGNADFLKAAASALKPGARFVLDTSYVAEVILPVLQERGWYRLGDILTLSQRRYDPAEGRLHVEYTFIRDGKTETWPTSARISTYREVFKLLEDAGFDDLQSYGSVAREPFKLGSARLLVSARKRPNE